LDGGVNDIHNIRYPATCVVHVRVHSTIHECCDLTVLSKQDRLANGQDERQLESASEAINFVLNCLSLQSVVSYLNLTS